MSIRKFGLCWAVAAVLFAGVSTRANEAGGFTFADTAGKYLDVLLDGKIAVRFMYGHDTTSAASKIETYKPYLHVFDAEGKAPITKGPGGQFPHHRGIFIGWNKVTVGGKSVDLWHMKGTEIVHQKFGEQKGGDSATFTAMINWIIEPANTVIEEERTFTIQKAPAPARLIIDFTSKLKAVAGDIELNGDPEHAGIHYRPANEVTAAETVYTFPKEGADAHKDTDLPWIAETYTLAGKKYSIVEMNHPDNPKKSRISAYRDYGRMGYFPVASIKNGESLTVKYRFEIADGEMLGADVIQKSWDEFAGASNTPMPKITVKAAEAMGGKKQPAEPKPK